MQRTLTPLNHHQLSINSNPTRYDTFTTTILSNVTMRGYKYFEYPVEAGNWWVGVVGV